jgi:hypothetical protein
MNEGTKKKDWNQTIMMQQKTTNMMVMNEFLNSQTITYNSAQPNQLIKAPV